MKRLCSVFLLAVFLFPVSAHRPVTHDVPYKQLYDAFAADVLLHNRFGRTVFYSWTTQQQIDTLRKGAPFLLKSQSDEGAVSLYDVSLQDKKYSNNPLAALLRNPAFARKRYAWSNPWATCDALSPEYYGDQLIEIILEDSAYICGFFPGEKEPFRVMCADGKPVSVQEAVKHPDRIGAVYHVNSMNKRPFGKVKYDGTRWMPGKRFTRYYEPFREYIIVNERMVRQWSYGTPGIVDRMAKDAYKFKRLAETEKFTPQLKGYCGKNYAERWHAAAAEQTSEACVLQGAAFTKMDLDTDVCVQIAKELQEAFFTQQKLIIKYPSKKYH